MKVCFVTANHPPESVGGTEQVVTALARELRPLGVAVTVISGSDVHHDGAVDEHVEEFEGVPVFRLRRRHGEDDTQGVTRRRILELVERRLRTIAPDVVHVHSFSHLSAGIGTVCRDLSRPMVMTFHDLWVTCPRYFRIPAGGVRCPSGQDRTPCVTCVNDALQTDPDRVRSLLAHRDLEIREDVERAAVRTAPSRTAARIVQECLPCRDPIEVIPHGLLRPVPAQHLAGPLRAGEPLRIGTFGGLVAEKGVLELVEAVAGLSCELHLAGAFHGQGFEQRVRDTAARQGTKLVLRGRFGPADRHPARDLHLAVFPSRCQETYGLVVDEALAHGVPAVVSDQGAFAERRRDGGVVVTEIARLANVLRELVNSPAKLAALRAAVPTSLPTIAASAARHFELYSRLR